MNNSYTSPNFYYNDVQCYFRIFPNGEYNNGYVELRLGKFHGDPISIKISFALKTVNGEKHMEREYTSIFGARLNYFTFREFISRAELERKKTELLPDNSVLTIVFTLQSASEDEIATTSCSYCKKIFDAEKLSCHEKKCRVKCPECSNVVLLQNWDEHECQISRAEAATNTTESFLVQHHVKILQDLKQLFTKQEICDVTLRVKGQEFQAHKAILAARSPVFFSTFRNDMKERETGIVEIEDCDPSIFPHFLCFLYSDDVDNLSEENVFGLFTAADKCDITDLRQKCLEFMKENLSVETFCETLTLALQHSEAELIHFATDFFNNTRLPKEVILTAFQFQLEKQLCI